MALKTTEEQIERTQVEQVFGLTGGELDDSAWKVGEKTIAPYWYEGAPEYAASDFRDLENVRTAVHCALYGSSPERIDDEGGAWVRKGEFQTSGETECLFHSGAPEDMPVKRDQCHMVASYPRKHLVGTFAKLTAKHAECPFCGARLGEDHGVIYLGDGWVETVYVFEPTKVTLTIEIVGEAPSLADALAEILHSVEKGNTSGSDSNTRGRFKFEIK